jgi:Holliday junction resolvasome RuvABC endonuclease subunit
MIIVGIDPSLSNFGLAKGILDTDSGTFLLQDLLLQSTKPNKAKQQRVSNDDFNRAKLLSTATMSFIKGADIIIAELPIGGQNSRSAISYGMSIGIVASLQKPVIQVEPIEVKLHATGNKNASKADMIKWAVAQYPDADWLTHKKNGVTCISAANEHLADAVAVIHAGVRSDTFQQLLTFQRTLL